MDSVLIVLIVFIIASFSGPFGGNIIFPVFRNIQEEFLVPKLYINLLVTLYMIPFSILQLFSGILSDLFYGRKKVILFGTILYLIGALLGYLSPNIWILMVSRAIQGVGSAFISPITMALVGDFFEVRKRGKVMGFGALATTLGSTLGPLVGGYLGLINWRLIFIPTGVIGGTVLVTTLFLPREKEQRRGISSDLLPMITSCLANPAVLTIGFLGMLLFFTRMSIYTFLSNTVLYPPYNLSSDMWGFYISLAGFGGMIASLLAGYLTDAWGRKKLVISAFSLLFLILMLYQLPNWYLILPILLFLLGSVSTLAMTPLNTLSVEINPRMRGSAAAIYGFLRFLGYALGPILPYPLYIVYGFESIILIDAALVLIGLTLFIALFMTKQESRSIVSL